jgi:hypothetical protein
LIMSINLLMSYGQESGTCAPKPIERISYTYWLCHR